MAEQRPDRRPRLTRADLPDQLTAETIRELPIATLRRFADHRNGVLTADEQRDFDKVVHEVMRDTAQRVSRQLDKADWSTVRRREDTRKPRTGAQTSGTRRQLDRIARRIGEQVDLAETLAPGVDWSFAQPATAQEETPTDTTDTDEQSGTVADLEQRLTEQVELVEVMSEIADVGKRTYRLEQQRDLQSTRTLFFGLVVSVAVLVAGWAPLVAAHDWTERTWIIVLTVATCLLAAAVYGLVRMWQNRHEPADDTTGDAADDAA